MTIALYKIKNNEISAIIDRIKQQINLIFAVYVRKGYHIVVKRIIKFKNRDIRMTFKTLSGKFREKANCLVQLLYQKFNYAKRVILQEEKRIFSRNGASGQVMRSVVIKNNR